MPEKTNERRDSSARENPEAKEKPTESTVGHLIAFVKCKVLGACEVAEARKRTGELRKSLEIEKPASVRVDLSPLGKIVPKIGRTGTVRKMLF